MLFGDAHGALEPDLGAGVVVRISKWPRQQEPSEGFVAKMSR